MLLCAIIFCACSGKADTDGFSLENAEPVGQMELMYATQFSVDHYESGISLLNVSDGEKYLLVPENENVEDIPDNITIIHIPADNIYLAASSAMDMFFGIGADGNVRATATLERDWALPEVKEAMGNEDILYAGKYSAPDYELILSEG